MSPMIRIPLRNSPITATLAGLIRDTRRTIGWSQEELADHALTSQAKISRMEGDKRGAIDLETLDRVLAELGLWVTLEVDGPHVTERREQRDVVHGWIVEVLARRLRRAGWAVATEVATGPGAPSGWIDLIAYRVADAALLVIEVKTAIPDVGALLRQVGRYEREAPWAARRMGWLPEWIAVAVVCLDSAQVRDVLHLNRALLASEFTAPPDGLIAWVRRPKATPSTGRTMLNVDLGRRQGLGLEPTVLHGRRAAPAFRDYADAAATRATARR